MAEKIRPVITIDYEEYRDLQKKAAEGITRFLDLGDTVGIITPTERIANTLTVHQRSVDNNGSCTYILTGGYRIIIYPPKV